jgi:hypothetical protein
MTDSRSQPSIETIINELRVSGDPTELEWADAIDALKARAAELESELASCRACREKIDCLSRGEAVQQGDGP